MGPVGPVGVPGGPGGLVWKDSEGHIAGLGELLILADASGVIWPISPETGRVDTVHTADVQFYRFWETADCTGTVFLQIPTPPLPREPFKFEGGTSWMVRRDTAPPVNQLMQSTMQGGGCIAARVTGPYFRESDFQAIGGPPLLSYVGPLHLERVAP